MRYGMLVRQSVATVLCGCQNVYLLIKRARAQAMSRFLVAILFGFMLIPAADAQQAGGGPPESGAVTPSDGPRRLGNVVTDQMRQFKMRKDCELDLPECIPAIREII